MEIEAVCVSVKVQSTFHSIFLGFFYSDCTSFHTDEGLLFILTLYPSFRMGAITSVATFKPYGSYFRKS
jgi:hypothetical protein